LLEKLVAFRGKIVFDIRLYYSRKSNRSHPFSKARKSACSTIGSIKLPRVAYLLQSASAKKKLTTAVIWPLNTTNLHTSYHFDRSDSNPFIGKRSYFGLLPDVQCCPSLFIDKKRSFSKTAVQGTGFNGITDRCLANPINTVFSQKLQEISF